MSAKVLIVEDELIVADDLAWKLNEVGYEVVGTAGSAEEAVEIAEREHPQIALMDIQIRGAMDGLEVAKIIHRRSGTKIIFVTAFPAVFLNDSGEERLPGLCLSKPFSMLQLKAALQAISAPSDSTPEASSPNPQNL